MNLVKLFSSLETPEAGNFNLFNALTLANYPFAKIAKNCEEHPVILISSIRGGGNLVQKNVRLKYLELSHNLECKVLENNHEHYANFTLIIFKSNLYYLQNYFLGIAETLIKSLSLTPTDQEVLKTFRDFVEIFHSLSNPPTKTTQGLWAELLLIETSYNPSKLLNYWHNNPQDKFDFNADVEKLEVKSSSNGERVHTFSSEQLTPNNNDQVLIASLFTKQITHGVSILDLTIVIQNKIKEVELSEKLFSIVNKTLGHSIEQAIKIKYDYELAKNSLRFYRHQDISKIEKINIPNKVSDVRYKSDLSLVKAVFPKDSSISGILFTSI
ncbi:MAG: hypothetical protein BroJett005_21880 [Ignavibacteriota bacterium]|nr:MAG: hypothetical protein BroJett005_21880 [Ignavibacteriota bacterium]